jgi:D-3-phosphoglycerate dehydrogenase
MKYQVYRTNSSTYQDSEFFNLEKDELESIENVQYIKSLTEVDDTAPFILLSNTHTIPEELPEVLLDKTILMIHPNSGHENIPKAFVGRMEFPIVLGNPIRSHAVTEYILSCLFHHYTPISNHQYWSHDRKWERDLLRDQNVLILGFGHIGKLLYRTLSVLCKKVEVADPYYDEDIKTKDIKKELSEIDLTKKSIIILAASLTSSSQNIINNDFLKALPNDALLINAARGEILNEEELSLFLKKNEKFFSYLDVYSREPFIPGYMHDISNVNKTSHIAGVYTDLNADIVKFEKHIIEDFIKFYEARNINQFKAQYKECILTENSNNYK